MKGFLPYGALAWCLQVLVAGSACPIVQASRRKPLPFFVTNPKESDDHNPLSD